MYLCSQTHSWQPRRVYWSGLEPTMNTKPIEEGTSRLTFGLRKQQRVRIPTSKDGSGTASPHLFQVLSRDLQQLPWKSTSYPASTTRPFLSLVCTRGPFLSGRTGKGPSSSSSSPSCKVTKGRGDVEAWNQGETPPCHRGLGCLPVVTSSRRACL